ncbi:AMP-binding protein [Photorhabdus tasmaniensis]
MQVVNLSKASLFQSAIYREWLAKPTQKYNVPISFEINGIIDNLRLKNCIEEVMNNRLKLARKFFIDNDIVYISESEISNGGYVVIIQEPDNVFEKEVLNTVFDLSVGFCWKGVIDVRSKSIAKLTLVIHHSIVDATTYQFVLQEISSMYKREEVSLSCEYHPIESYITNVQGYLDSRQGIRNRNEIEQEYLKIADNINEISLVEGLRSQENFFYKEFDHIFYQKVEQYANEHDVSPFSFILYKLAKNLTPFLRSDYIVFSIQVNNRPKNLTYVTGPAMNSVLVCVDVTQDVTPKSIQKSLRKSYKFANFPYSETQRLVKFELSKCINVSFHETYNSSLHLGDEINITQESVWHDLYKANLSIAIEYGDEKTRIEYEYNSEVISKDLLDYLSHIAEEDEKRTKRQRVVAKPSSNQYMADPSSFFYYLKEKFLSLMISDSTGLQQRQHVLSLSRSLEENICRANTPIILIELPRSLEQVLVVLVCLSNGIPFVPIDPKWHEERKSSIRLKFASYTICALNEGVVNFSHSRSVCRVSEDFGDSAYVIFTSGSTGEPKGVVVNRSALASHIIGVDESIDLSKNTKSLLSTSPTFDIYYLELLLPVYKGWAIRIIDDNEKLDIDTLLDIIDREHIDFIQHTPSMWERYLHSTRKICVETAIFGGEPLSANTLKIMNRLDIKQAFNFYGPTETTIWSSFHKIEAEQFNVTTVGKPLSGESIAVVNHNAISPRGCIGEIAISGEGLARGYLDNQYLTGEKFKEIEGERFYLTGDIGYVDKEDNLHIIGRINDELKWNGFRINLAEIDNILAGDEMVESSKTILVDGNIVCFYISPTDINPNLARNRITQILPHYVHLSEFVRMDTFPVTTGGKVNKVALHDAYIKNQTRDYSCHLPKLSDVLHVLSSIKGRVPKENESLLSQGYTSLDIIIFTSIVNSKFRINISPVMDLANKNVVNIYENIKSAAVMAG